MKEKVYVHNFMTFVRGRKLLLIELVLSKQTKSEIHSYVKDEEIFQFTENPLTILPLKDVYFLFLHNF